MYRKKLLYSIHGKTVTYDRSYPQEAELVFFGFVLKIRVRGVCFFFVKIRQEVTRENMYMFKAWKAVMNVSYSQLLRKESIWVIKN